jgi:hypothetical protein
MNHMLLAAVRAYWKYTPASLRAAMSTAGTSVAAYEKISSQRPLAALGTFVSAALPLRKLGAALGVYEGQGDW